MGYKDDKAREAVRNSLYIHMYIYTHTYIYIHKIIYILQKSSLKSIYRTRSLINEFTMSIILTKSERFGSRPHRIYLQSILIAYIVYKIHISC